MFCSCVVRCAFCVACCLLDVVFVSVVCIRLLSGVCGLLIDVCCLLHASCSSVLSVVWCVLCVVSCCSLIGGCLLLAVCCFGDGCLMFVA